MLRTDFLKLSLAGVAGALTLSPLALLGQQAAKPPAVPQLHPETVKEFVGKAHNNIECVREMLDYYPTLLNATWDWGGGDFETGLNAAGHVGDKEIAHLLLERGARADIFLLAMLGKTVLVKSILELFPPLLNSYGPHGFTLLHHTEKGGEDARELHEWLQEKGLKEKRRMDLFK